MMWYDEGPVPVHVCPVCQEVWASFHTCKGKVGWRQPTERLVEKAVAEYLQRWFEL
jgi:hypothetical protein